MESNSLWECAALILYDAVASNYMHKLPVLLNYIFYCFKFIVGKNPRPFIQNIKFRSWHSIFMSLPCRPSACRLHGMHTSVSELSCCFGETATLQCTVTAILYIMYRVRFVV